MPETTDPAASALDKIRADLRTATDGGLLGIKAGDYLPAALARHSRDLLKAVEAALKLADEAIPALGAIHCTCAGNGADDTCRCPERPVAWTLDPAKLRADITAALAGKEADR